MKIAVIQFPGSNCERETGMAIERAGMTPLFFLWNEPVEKLMGCDGFVIVGGFSYEDRSRAGVISALDPVIKVLSEQAMLGKPVLGICNGAQILVESGLVPGVKHQEVVVGLTQNKRIYFDKVMGTGYYNAWIHMKTSEASKHNVFTSSMAKEDTMQVPIAHAEGRFVMSDKVLEQVKKHGLITFQYCDDKGKLNSEFPVNPNGSVENIAALSNLSGNVMAMMPHPERTENGDAIFSSMRDYIAEQDMLSYEVLDMTVPDTKIPAYQLEGKQFVVDQVITDNAAVTVQKTLVRLGIDVKVKRFSHWVVRAMSETVVDQVLATEELYNPRKAFLVSKDELQTDDETAFLLVRQKEDAAGMQKYQLLVNHFEINGLQKIEEGVLWKITSSSGVLKAKLEKIISTGVLFNHAAHNVFSF